MLISELYLDVDGVLADFAGAALALFGLQKPNRETWDLMDDDLIGSCVPNEATMWKEIHKRGHGFWKNIETLPWANELYLICKEQADHVFFCTSPSRSPFSCSGKYAWLEDFAGPVNIRNTIITPKKHMLAKPTALLIDDHPPKADLFHQHGGKAILFPAPWNGRSKLLHQLNVDSPIDRYTKLVHLIQEEIDRIRVDMGNERRR